MGGRGAWAPEKDFFQGEVGQEWWTKAAIGLGVLYLGQGHGIAWGGRYVTGQTRVGPGAPHWAGCGNVTRYVTEAGGGRSCGT